MHRRGGVAVQTNRPDWIALINCSPTTAHLDTLFHFHRLPPQSYSLTSLPDHRSLEIQRHIHTP
jgi:hypothetical protein